MTPFRRLPAQSAETSFEGAVAAFATARASRDEIGRLRTCLQLPGRKPFAPSFLKHSDEQTVVGLAAVFDAVRRCNMIQNQFDGWGALAAPRYLGREIIASSVQRFQQEGAWGVSPHIIPHRSLHSFSGTISLALGLRGPNFGVGGGPNGPSEMLLAALALLSDGKVPGVWIVMSGWEPELIPKRSNCTDSIDTATSICRAVAMALTPCARGRRGPRLRLVLQIPGADSPLFGVKTLSDVLDQRSMIPTILQLSGGDSIEFIDLNLAAECPT